MLITEKLLEITKKGEGLERQLRVNNGNIKERLYVFSYVYNTVHIILKSEIYGLISVNSLAPLNTHSSEWEGSTLPTASEAHGPGTDADR